MLKRLRNILTFNIRKQLVQTLVLSKLYYNCVVYHNLPHHFLTRLQRIQTACASFVVGKFVEREDIIKLNWSPIKEHLEWQLLKSVHKTLYSNELTSQFKQYRALRSSVATQFETSLVSHTFQDQAAKNFDTLPQHIRNCIGFQHFTKLTFNFLMKTVNDDL